MKPKEMVVGKRYQLRTHRGEWGIVRRLIYKDVGNYRFVDHGAPDDDVLAVFCGNETFRECCPHGHGLDETCRECVPADDPIGDRVVVRARIVRGSADFMEAVNQAHNLEYTAFTRDEVLAMLQLCAEHNIITAEQLRSAIEAGTYDTARHDSWCCAKRGSCFHVDELREKLVAAELVVADYERLATAKREAEAECERLKAEQIELAKVLMLCTRALGVTEVQRLRDKSVEESKVYYTEPLMAKWLKKTDHYQPSAAAKAPAAQRGAVVRCQSDEDEP